MSALTSIVTDGVTMLAQEAPKFVSVSFQFVEALASGLLGAKDSIIKAFNESVNVLISGADSWLTQNGASLYDFGMKMINSIFNAFSSAGDLISEHIGQFIPLIANAFLSFHESLFTVGLDILGAIGQGLVKSKDTIQEMASSTIFNMVNALVENAPFIIDGGIALIESLVGSLLENASLVAGSAVEIIAQLAARIGEAAPDLIPAAVEAVLKFLEGLTNPESLNNLISGALSLIEGLGDGIIKAIPLLIEYGPEIIVNIVAGIMSALPQLLEVGGQLIAGLGEGILQGLAIIPDTIARVANAIVDGFKALFGIHSPSTVFADIGGLLIQGLMNGITDAWKSLTNVVSGLFDGLIGGVKSLLGIHSPSTVFANIGSNMALGLGEGWDDEYRAIKDKIKDGLDFGTASVALTANASYNSQKPVQDGQQGGLGGAGNTYVTINSPVAVDAVTAAREWKKTTQRMAMSYV